MTHPEPGLLYSAHADAPKTLTYVAIAIGLSKAASQTRARRGSVWNEELVRGLIESGFIRVPFSELPINL